MWISEFGAQLGKISLYGKGRNSIGTHNFRAGIEVDKAKVKVIETLPPMANIKGVCKFFLGHAGDACVLYLGF